jgi:wyosine [tRNA(Phe)-imidazoG37] synthetase (radical SAM superfamily)
MNETAAVRREHGSHPRDLGGTTYVYAVLSRRSGGISIGVNLNPDKRCNFDCVYCQVDRRAVPPPMAVDLETLADELTGVLTAAKDGSLAAHPRFRDLPEVLREVRDVALSGDGEPTTAPQFDRIVDRVLDVLAATGWEGLPVVLITNASGLDRPAVRAGVDRIVAAGGDVWAKLDAGTEGYFTKVCGTQVPYAKVLANLGETARRHPITLQTCLLAMDGGGPPEAEIAAYVDRVREIVDGGGRLRGVQLYTVARPPAQSHVTPLAAEALEGVAERLRAAVPGVPVGVFPSTSKKLARNPGTGV